METVTERTLQRWRDADLVTEEQVAAIRAWEAAQDTPPPPAPAVAAPDALPLEAPPPPSAATVARPGVGILAEGLAYVGAALAFGAGLILFGELWEDLGATARIGLALVGTLILGGGAWALRDRAIGSLHRLGTVLASLFVVGVGTTVAIALVEATSVDDTTVGVVAGLAALAAAVPVHLARASWPTTLALGAAVLTTVFSFEAQLDLFDSAIPAGITLMGLGLAWAAAGWSGLTRPQTAFEVTGLLAGGMGVQILSFDAATVPALVVGLLVAAGALAVGLDEDRTAPAVLGGFGITVFAPQLVFELFGDTVGAPLALFVGGVSLVTVAVVILRRRIEA